MITQDFLKEDCVAAFGSVGKLAEFLGINSQAVSQWKEGESIPELRKMQILVYRPDLVSAGKRRK